MSELSGFGSKCEHGALLVNTCPDCFKDQANANAGLRDRFAMAALTGVMAATAGTTISAKESDGLASNLAIAAYRVADAMLKERAKVGQTPIGQ